MLKTYEVMTHELAVCAPDTSVADVAAMMCDRDIGDVLVMENGKLRGIVTDRDLAVHALTGKDDPRKTPVRKFMSTRVVTGQAEWSLEEAAKVMASHHIRRLPIVQDGEVVGILSFGDLALHENRKSVLTKSLKAISKPNSVVNAERTRRGAALIGLGLTALTTAGMAWLTWNRSGGMLRRQLAKLKPAVVAEDGEVAAKTESKRWARRIRREVLAMPENQPVAEGKPARRLFGLFG